MAATVTREFKVGDKVRVLSPKLKLYDTVLLSNLAQTCTWSPSNLNSVGRIGTVAEIHTPDHISVGFDGSPHFCFWTGWLEPVLDPAPADPKPEPIPLPPAPPVAKYKVGDLVAKLKKDFSTLKEANDKNLLRTNEVMYERDAYKTQLLGCNQLVEQHERLISEIKSLLALEQEKTLRLGARLAELTPPPPPKTALERFVSRACYGSLSAAGIAAEWAIGVLCIGALYLAMPLAVGGKLAWGGGRTIGRALTKYAIELAVAGAFGTMFGTGLCRIAAQAEYNEAAQNSSSPPGPVKKRWL